MPEQTKKRLTKAEAEELKLKRRISSAQSQARWLLKHDPALGKALADEFLKKHKEMRAD